MKTLALAVVLMFAAYASIEAQTAPLKPPEAPPAAADITFEVASVKLTPYPADGRFVIGGKFTPNGYEGNYISLKECIRDAYNIARWENIVGPAWLDSGSSPYSIVAKASKAMPEGALHIMLQHLLAERFGLKAHMESREMPVYALVVEKGGMKAQPVVYEEADADQCVHPEPTGLTAHHCSMATFSKVLSGAMSLGRPVIDMTGLSGRFDFTLRHLTKGWAPLLDPPADGPGGPTIFDSIQTIGLKLDARKAPVEVLVIDYVNKAPTEN